MSKCRVSRGPAIIDLPRHNAHFCVLNELEATSPGAKAVFCPSFLDNVAPLLAGTRAAVVESLSRCGRCGAPTTGDLCGFCRLVDVATAHEPVPIEMLRPAKARRARG